MIATLMAEQAPNLLQWSLIGGGLLLMSAFGAVCSWLMTWRSMRRGGSMPYDALKQYQWRRRQRMMAALLRPWR